MQAVPLSRSGVLCRSLREAIHPDENSLGYVPLLVQVTDLGILHGELKLRKQLVICNKHVAQISNGFDVWFCRAAFRACYHLAVVAVGAAVSVRVCWPRNQAP